MLKDPGLRHQIPLKAKELVGLIARKDLTRRLAEAHPLPTYVTEPILAERLASKAPRRDRGPLSATWERDPYEGETALEALTETQGLLSEEAAVPGDEETIGFKARQEGSACVIGHVQARYNSGRDEYLAELSRLNLGPMSIDPELIRRHQRMLRDGFYARIKIEPDTSGPGDFRILALGPIQHSGGGSPAEDVLEQVDFALLGFRHAGWLYFLFQSLGLDPFSLSEKALEAILLRLVPLVVKNYNLIELGPRGTGKSHLFEKVTPLAHVLSSGQATAAQLFVNAGTGEPGLVTTQDLVCFDEVAEVSFRDRNGAVALRGYMESGRFGRGKQEGRGEASLVFLGNLTSGAAGQCAERKGEKHLLCPLPKKLRDDTAFMARLHAFVPGWQVPKIGPDHLTDGLGLTYGAITDLFSELRELSRIEELRDRVELGDALNGRDRKAAWKTIDGLAKLCFLRSGMELSYPIEYVVDLALRARRRVKEQQRRIQPDEYGETAFRYRVDGKGEMKEAVPNELKGTQAEPAGDAALKPR